MLNQKRRIVLHELNGRQLVLDFPFAIFRILQAGCADKEAVSESHAIDLWREQLPETWNYVAVQDGHYFVLKLPSLVWVVGTTGGDIPKQYGSFAAARRDFEDRVTGIAKWQSL